MLNDEVGSEMFMRDRCSLARLGETRSSMCCVKSVAPWNDVCSQKPARVLAISSPLLRFFVAFVERMCGQSFLAARPDVSRNVEATNAT